MFASVPFAPSSFPPVSMKVGSAVCLMSPLYVTVARLSSSATVVADEIDDVRVMVTELVRYRLSLRRLDVYSGAPERRWKVVSVCFENETNAVVQRENTG